MTKTVWKCDACLLTTCSFIVLSREDFTFGTPNQCPYCADGITDFKKVSECDVPEKEEYKEEEK